MHALRNLLRLAMSVLIGQLAVIGFGVADTVMLGHYSTTANLATLSIGQAIYITLYVSLSGVTQSLLPTLGRGFGAGSPQAVGAGFRQGLWLVAGLSLVGIAVLLWPQPLLSLTGQARDPMVDRYLQILAFGLPAALAFRVHAALSQAISRPLLTAGLQIGGLLTKLLLNVVFLLPEQFGLHGMQALGAAGCAAATVLTQYGLLALALVQHRRSSALRTYAVFSRWDWPSWTAQAHLLRLGAPIGLSLLVEVSAFTFMALFIARLGDTVLAAHQITANFATVLYMLPLSISIATGSVVAQHLGAGNARAARQTAWSGVGAAALLSACIALTVWLGHRQIVGWYTSDPKVQAVADHLFLFIALYQVFDAVQSTSAFVLRSYHIAVVPSVLYALSLWGIGLGGGYMLGFNILGISPPALQGAAGFWMGNTTGLGVAASCFALLLWRVARTPPR
ncbi:MAG: MATE family efflux transporter [Thiomonas sp.]